MQETWLKMTRNEAKDKISIRNEETYPYKVVDNVNEVIDEIFDQQDKLEAELRTKDERIEAQSSVIIACQNAILQKDERITELEAKLESLRGYCRKLIEHFNSKDSRSDYDWGLRDRTITILDKLDEGKEQ